MKKSLGMLIVIFLFMTGTSAIAAEKIGFINMKEVLILSDAGKTAAADFQKIFEKTRATIQATEQDLKKKKEELEKQRPVLTESAMREKELEYQKEFRDYKRLVEDSNAEMQRKDQELSQQLIPEILKVINDIGEKEGYTMIVDVNANGMVYSSQAKDITKMIIREFNKAYKAGKK